MGETLTAQQLLNNSYHLAIRSSLLAIQSTLFLQETMLQSQHATFTDIKTTIASQNKTLHHITKTLADTFSKISSYQHPPQLSSAKPPQIHAAPLQTSVPRPSKLPLTSSASTSTLPINSCPRLMPSLSPPAAILHGSPPPSASAPTTAATTISTAAPPISTVAAPSITSPIPTPLWTPSLSLQTQHRSLTSHRDVVQSYAFVSDWLQSRFCYLETKNVYAEMVVFYHGAPKVFDEMVEKKTAKLVEEEKMLNKVSRLFESIGDKFKLFSCDFLTIGLAKAVFVHEASYVFGERPRRTEITWSTFVVHIFDPGGMLDAMSTFDLEGKVAFRARGNDTTEPAHNISARPRRTIKIPSKYLQQQQHQHLNNKYMTA